MTSQILIAYGSKHGSTAEIAEKIGQVLRESGHAVDVLPIKKIKQIDQYQAVILGSGIYIGYWMKAAASFLKKYENDLKSKAVWIFSSGPTGDADVETLLQGWTFPKGLQPVVDRIQPREVVTFHGRLDPQKMNFWERWIINKVNAPLGDFRDWEKVVLWAEGIAHSLGKPLF
jgi:menaquinone-dependent protoporphyrinogen oxidase